MAKIPQKVTSSSFEKDITNALDKRLTIADNMDGEIRTILVDGIYPLYLAWYRALPPVVAIVGATRRLSSLPFTLTNAIGVDWEFSDNRVKIKGFPGISPSITDQYEVKVIFLVG